MDLHAVAGDHSIRSPPLLRLCLRVPWPLDSVVPLLTQPVVVVVDDGARYSAWSSGGGAAGVPAVD